MRALALRSASSLATQTTLGAACQAASAEHLTAQLAGCASHTKRLSATGPSQQQQPGSSPLACTPAGHLCWSGDCSCRLLPQIFWSLPAPGRHSEDLTACQLAGHWQSAKMGASASLAQQTARCACGTWGSSAACRPTPLTQTLCGLWLLAQTLALSTLGAGTAAFTGAPLLRTAVVCSAASMGSRGMQSSAQKGLRAWYWLLSGTLQQPCAAWLCSRAGSRSARGLALTAAMLLSEVVL